MLSCFSHVQSSVVSVSVFLTPWTVACQAPLSVGFSRQEYWSALPFPPPGDLPDPGIKPTSLMSPALAGRFFTTSATWELHADPNSFVGFIQPTVEWQIWFQANLHLCGKAYCHLAEVRMHGPSPIPETLPLYSLKFKVYH